ncbi:CAP domain-containing protein [Natronomonas sp. EA1]|uniref:CAP domain-containing protein n=1 Tax=Natronomonas sp. EA1 TaxID=3421655 RepID=UPI003EBCFCC7
MDCSVCGREVPVSAACRHCAAPVCEEHRSPAAHDCPGVEGRYTDYGAPRTREVPETPRLSDPQRLLKGLLVAVVLALAVAGALAAAPDPGLDEQRVERLVHAEINEEREARGLAPLAYNETLAAVAEAHSRDMLEREYFAHEAPNGSGLADRYRRAGIDCPGGENIYTTPNGELAVSEQALADRIVREWMRSPGHRENVLKARFSREGIGIVVADDGVYATQNFC